MASKVRSVFLQADNALIRPSDKTQVFHDQIEQKQKELQPWKMKVNQKQAEIDVKTSERDMLIKKAETIKQASAEAHEALENLRNDQKTKVCVLDHLEYPEYLSRAQIGELENLKHRKQSLQQESKATRQRVQKPKPRLRPKLKPKPHDKEKLPNRWCS